VGRFDGGKQLAIWTARRGRRTSGPQFKSAASCSRRSGAGVVVNDLGGSQKWRPRTTRRPTTPRGPRKAGASKMRSRQKAAGGGGGNYEPAFRSCEGAEGHVIPEAGGRTRSAALSELDRAHSQPGILR